MKKAEVFVAQYGMSQPHVFNADANTNTTLCVSKHTYAALNEKLKHRYTKNLLKHVSACTQIIVL